MAEPQDSYDAMVQTISNYNYGTASADDVRRALIWAIQQGNDKLTVATYANAQAKPPPGQGTKWLDPGDGTSLYPASTEIPIDLTDNISQIN